MPWVKTIRIILILLTAVYIGSLLAFLAYIWTRGMLGGSYSFVREYFAGFVGLIVWSASSLSIGSYIEKKTQKK